MSGEIPISSVLVKPVSADCNLECEYCFYMSKLDLYPETKRHRMNDKVLRTLISQFISLSLDRVSFCWQGGEPTLAGLDFYKQVVKYQALFGLPDQIVENSLQTNGIRIDDEWAWFLARYNFLVGVSLDGPAKINDYYRRDCGGGNSFKRVMNGIKFLRNHEVEFNILILLNSQNIKHPKELYRFFVDQGFKYLQFIPCVERDLETGGVTSFSITTEEYGRFLCEVFDEWTCNGIPNIYIRDFEELLISYVAGEAPSCTFSRDCGKYVVIEYNGDVYPCDFFVEPKWFLGNILEQPLEEIVECEKMIEFSQQKSRLSIRCDGCSWLQYCHAGCPKHWVQLDLDYNYFCKSFQSFFKHAHEKFLDLKKVVEQTMVVGSGGRTS